VTLDEFVKCSQDNVPFVLKGSSPGHEAAPGPIRKWFKLSKSAEGPVLAYATPYLNDLGDTSLTYEWTRTPTSERFIASLQQEELRTFLYAGKESSEPAPAYVRFTAPLSLFIAALQYNNSRSVTTDKLTSLYIAQSSISALPQTLQDDLAPPAVIDSTSIYNSSIWLGLTPTYTPLHRDPNPNIFRQLYGSKVVRILPPRAGEAVFKKIQSSIGGSASSRLRGEEMMQGPEKNLLHDAIWGEEGSGGRTIHEARLAAGDALYLPEGWWHSIKSAPSDAGVGAACQGELNCSVNWWFRSLAGK
jgi:hypothetical protein